MRPDDPRHGTTRGWHQGCKCIACRHAFSVYEMRRRKRKALYGHGYSVPALGAQRRIRALMALGWTSSDIATAAGWAHRNCVLRILNGQKGKPTTWLERATHDAIVETFSRLCMQIPDPAPHRARTKSLAARRGWQPPLAWDDIDDPTERPSLDERSKTVDEAVVLRILAGDHIKATRAEKAEVCRRWVALGRSLTELQRMTGWKPERYYKAGEAAA